MVQTWTSIQKKKEEECGLNLVSCPYGFTMSHCFADMLATGVCPVHNLIYVG